MRVTLSHESVLKARDAQSGTLDGGDKCALPSGASVVGVLESANAAGDHLRVAFRGEAPGCSGKPGVVGGGWFYRSHIAIEPASADSDSAVDATPIPVGTPGAPAGTPGTPEGTPGTPGIPAGSPTTHAPPVP